MTRALTALLLSSLGTPAAAAPTPAAGPRAVLERALDAIGRPSAVAAAGGAVVHAAGTRNQAAERQGRGPHSADRVPFRETIALDPARGRLAREHRYDRHDGTFEWLRDLYEGDADRKILVSQDGFAVWLRSPDHAAARRRYERRLPHVLLAEALERPEALTLAGTRGGRTAVEAALRDGTRVTLLFDPQDGLPARVEYEADVQTWGDTTLAWTFADWAPATAGLRFPRRIAATVAGRPFIELEVSRVETGRAAVDALFALPAGLRLPESPHVLPARSDPSARAEVQQEAPGVYTVRNLRAGFHPLFVELGDCVLAVDAPAGYRLLEELPAGDVAPGPSSAWLSERFLDLIQQTLPGKRVCWAALTHFHGDHAGGLRAFVAAGATLLVSPGDRRAVEELIAAAHTVAPDRLAAAPRAAHVEVVAERRRLEGGGRRADVLPIGSNPHTDEMLVVHLPDERFLFVSDLLTPAALEEFPTASHAALDRRFVDWLDGAGLDPERVYAMHGSGVATRAHLDKLRARRPRLAGVIPDHPVDAAAGALPHVEPHLAAHPEDARRLVAASIVVAPDRDRPWHCAAFAPDDAGHSWRRDDFPIDRCIDPWLLASSTYRRVRFRCSSLRVPVSAAVSCASRRRLSRLANASLRFGDDRSPNVSARRL